MGETRVDLQHLLEDLRDAYTGALEETILTEVIANALDSGAALIHLRPDPAEGTLTIVDDGRGMQRRELARYHDVAASSKARGEGSALPASESSWGSWCLGRSLPKHVEARRMSRRSGISRPGIVRHGSGFRRRV